MRTIEQISNDISEQVFYNERHIDIMSAVKDVAKRSIIESQRWIPVEEKPKYECIITESSNNGNKHYHGVKYLLKGYYNDNKNLIGYETGEYVAVGACYYFLRPNNFTITNWRPIELL